MSFLVFHLSFNTTLVIFCLVCEISKKGLSIFIDGTYAGSTNVQKVLKSSDIPYFHFDYTIQSLVKMMELYLKKRRALDAVLIFQDEISCKEGLFYFIMNSPLRIILLDQLGTNVINRLKTLRPAPNYYAVIADTANMDRLFKTVRHNLNDVALFAIAIMIKIKISFTLQARESGLFNRLSDRWNLMFTDFDAENFEHSEYPEMSRLLPNKTVCCNPSCICSSYVTVRLLCGLLHGR